MPQQLLHRSEIGAVIEKMSGKAMPDGVRADLGVEANLLQVLGDFSTNRTATQSTAVLVHKEGRFIASGQFCFGEFDIVTVHVVSKCGQSMRSQWHDPLSATLSTNQNGLSGVVEIAAIDSDDFTHSDTG